MKETRHTRTHAHTVFNKHTNKQTHSLMTDNFLYSVKTNTHTHSESCEVFFCFHSFRAVKKRRKTTGVQAFVKLLIIRAK